MAARSAESPGRTATASGEFGEVIYEKIGIEALVGSDVEEKDKAVMKQWWQQHVTSAASSMELGLELKSWRCRKPQKQGINQKGVPKGQVYAKISFAVQNKEMEAAVCSALAKLGGIRKIGTPPRGTLEREARALLSKLK